MNRIKLKMAHKTALANEVPWNDNPDVLYAALENAGWRYDSGAEDWHKPELAPEDRPAFTPSDKQVRALRWLSAQSIDVNYDDMKHEIGVNIQERAKLRNAGLIEHYKHTWRPGRFYRITNAGRAYLAEIDAPGLVTVEPPSAPFIVKSGQTDAWYTEPVTSADGDKVEGRITKAESGYVVDTISTLASGLTLVSQGMRFDSFRWALESAGMLVKVELERLNNERAQEMGEDTEPEVKPETPRIKLLREKIARNERELESLRFELAQELSDL